jgi:hypothetical protein
MAHVDLPRGADKREDLWICDLIPKTSYVHGCLKDSWAPSGYLKSGYAWQISGAIRTWLQVGFDSNHFTWGDKKIPKFATILNTAMAAGGDAIKLAARLHGQSEIHCWVAGKNRKWLADIMQKALDAKIFRTQEGWESNYDRYRNPDGDEPGVIEFLKSNDEEPVVCSFSVCESFPGPHLVDLTQLPGYDENDSDASHDSFWELPKQQQWDLAFSQLDATLEMSPDNWETYYFAEGVTLFDIKAQVHEERVKKQMEEEAARGNSFGKAEIANKN